MRDNALASYLSYYARPANTQGSTGPQKNGGLPPIRAKMGRGLRPLPIWLRSPFQGGSPHQYLIQQGGPLPAIFLD